MSCFCDLKHAVESKSVECNGRAVSTDMAVRNWNNKKNSSMWNSLNILSHKISLIFLEYFFTVAWEKSSRFHQSFHSVALQNIRLACSSQLDDQPAFTGGSTKSFLCCHTRTQNFHAVCREANVRKEQTFQQKGMSRKLQVMNTDCRMWQCG
jgi:hypothetical protein